MRGRQERDLQYLSSPGDGIWLDSHRNCKPQTVKQNMPNDKRVNKRPFDKIQGLGRNF